MNGQVGRQTDGPTGRQAIASYDGLFEEVGERGHRMLAG